MTPTLTRRCVQNQHAETWLIFADDIQIASIGKRSDVPTHVDQWQWTVSFYPPSHRGVRAGGAARTFAEGALLSKVLGARASLNVTEADRLEHRRERAHTKWKYKMWEAGCRMPTQLASGRSQCYCGAEIDVQSIGPHIAAEHMT